MLTCDGFLTTNRLNFVEGFFRSSLPLLDTPQEFIDQFYFSADD